MPYRELESRWVAVSLDFFQLLFFWPVKFVIFGYTKRVSNQFTLAIALQS